jgi:hypothetical protein
MDEALPAEQPEPARPSALKRLGSHPVVTRLVRWAKIGGIALLATIGIFGAGFATGWASSNNLVLSAPAPSFEPTAAPPVVGFAASVLMPDVRGLGPDDAQQVLADAGVDLATVELTSRPAAGPDGLIIAQSPAFGAPAPDVVTLVVSEPATVPTAVGKRATSVISALSALGAQITRESVYVPGAAIGTVTAIEPAAGASLPSIVTLQVTAAPTTLNLADLRSTGSCDSSNTEKMDGKDWFEPVVCSSSSSERLGTWALKGAVVEITGTLGLLDSADSDSSLSVQLIGDGVVLGTYEISRGDPFEFTLATAGVSKLVVRVVSLSDDNPELVIGSFTARGSEAPMAELATS